MGVQFLVAILLCLFAGQWLDARLGTAPLLMVLGVFVGAGASIRHVPEGDSRLGAKHRKAMD